MKNFELAYPTSEVEAARLLAECDGMAAVLAGGTELLPLMHRGVVTATRLVNIMQIESLRAIDQDSAGNIWLGAAVTLEEVLSYSDEERLAPVQQVIGGISSLQLQSQGTLVGELLRRPTCWYFRNGQGLLADRGRSVLAGDNRYHAILGHEGPAKFVSPSRLAPALIALEARVRVIGPGGEEQFLRLEELYRTPTEEGQAEFSLPTAHLVTHLLLPRLAGWQAATYEVRQGEGPDQPLAAAAVALQLHAGRVQAARVVLGQVAPVPWVAEQAAEYLLGRTVTESSAAAAGRLSVAGATALSRNGYKIQLASVSVKRAVLRAAGLSTGGLDDPSTEMDSEPAALA